VPLVALGFAGCATTLTKDVVSTKEAPAAIGPYSQGVGRKSAVPRRASSIDPKTNQFNAGSIEDQTTLVLENLKAVVAAGGMTMADIVSTTVFLKDVNDWQDERRLRYLLQRQTAGPCHDSGGSPAQSTH
jgi:2-iminobutanoate/2-iminopropanoate deaminase